MEEEKEPAVNHVKEEEVKQPAEKLGTLAPPEEDVKSTTSSKKRKRSEFEAHLVQPEEVLEIKQEPSKKRKVNPKSPAPS